jgi:hypothetical protein
MPANNDQSSITIRNVATHLEANLFQSAPSFRHYIDASTFKSRLLLASLTLLRRRMAKAKRLVRHKTLVQVLGNEKFDVVCRIVQDVKDIKIQAFLKGSISRNLNAGNKKEENFPLLYHHGGMPPPVKALFFRTPLISSFELSPTVAIPNLDWDLMIDQANYNITAYKHWEQECTEE